ncbi:MAG: lipocalin-like domain-containing protein [Betaproteobacteria bacterium]
MRAGAGPRGGGAWRAALSAAAVALALPALRPLARPGPVASPGTRLDLGPAPGQSGFARVFEPRPFALPRDHGPHFEYQTEWWYFTGNLATADGRRLGFQLTFFRRGLSPGPPPPGPGLASNQAYLAHLALTDVEAGRHRAVERLARGAGGLAGAGGDPVSVWLESWRAGWDGGSWQLAAEDAASGLSLQLLLRPAKALVAQGDRGVSPKSSRPGNASYYVSYTRMAASGRIGLPEGGSDVAGEAWFDHEWSTSALGEDAVGWDWFSLQLDDGRELMLFRIRRADGGVEPVSSGTLVQADGRTARLARDDVRLEVLRRWTSPATGARYPASWRVVVPAVQLDLWVAPRLDDQELRASFVYWEGAVRVSGTGGGRQLSGQGYVELTGYGRSLRGAF